MTLRTSLALSVALALAACGTVDEIEDLAVLSVSGAAGFTMSRSEVPYSWPVPELKAGLDSTTARGIR